MMKRVIFPILMILFIGCSTQSKKKDVATEAPKVFTMASVPITITDPTLRAEYLVKHYWDKFDFADTAYIHLPKITEQALADYINVMNYASVEVVQTSIKSMLIKAEQDSLVYDHFIDLYEKYLHDPNSPVRNELFYMPVLEQIMTTSQLSDIHKIRYRKLLEIANKNKVGEPAIDFKFTNTQGRNLSLYGVKAVYTILFFYNPGCMACKEISTALVNSPLISTLVKQNKLKIIALYPDEDLTEWKSYQKNVPTQWINAYDPTRSIEQYELYDLKAIPTLYLLDKDKRVLLKDAMFPVLQAHLEQLVP